MLSFTLPLTSITIENFKGIGEKAVTIPIRPITLLFGKNSSGKSTVLQALRYLSAVMNQWPNLGRIEMSGGLDTDLNDFPSLVHRHELDRKIRIRVHTQIDSFKQWDEVVTMWKERDRGGHGHYLESYSWGYILETGEEICFSFGPKKERSADAVIGSNGEKLIFFQKIKIEDIVGQIYVNTTDLSNEAEKFIDYMKNLVHESFLNPKEPKKEKSIDNLVAFGRKRFIMRHLGPFREVPPRDDKILPPDEIPPPNELQWQKGLGAWDALARDPKLVKKTNHYLKEVLQLGYTIKQPEPGQNFQLHDENNEIDVGLSDVGVGIAQVIPVVVGTLDDGSNIFAVEQPELHVHPAVQVALGDLFIDSVKHREQAIEEFWQKIDLALAKKELIESIEESKRFAFFELSKEKLKIDEYNELIETIEYTESNEFMEFMEFMESIQENGEGQAECGVQAGFDSFSVIQKNPKIIENPVFLEFIATIQKSNRTLLIETHSEHLLLRLLRRVRETTRRRRRAETTESEQPCYELMPDDLSVIYVRSTPAGIKFTPINVTKDGDFDAPWPEGFFEERDSEWY